LSAFCWSSWLGDGGRLRAGGDGRVEEALSPSPSVRRIETPRRSAEAPRTNSGPANVGTGSRATTPRDCRTDGRPEERRRFQGGRRTSARRCFRARSSRRCGARDRPRDPVDVNVARPDHIVAGVDTGTGAILGEAKRLCEERGSRFLVLAILPWRVRGPHAGDADA
jgi:hypothetical protein